MASMRRLRRRLQAWERYEGKVYGPCSLAISPGSRRALVRVFNERTRREVATVYWPIERHLDDWAIHLEPW